MIESIYLSELGLATKGILRGEDIAFPSVAIDTRTLTAGELYIALQGEQFDGHQFVAQAVKKGCSSVVLSDADLAAGLHETPCLIVNNTLHALGECSRINRERFSLFLQYA